MNETLKPSSGDPNAYDQERERLHRQMLSTISHDLKTPIASIIGSLEVYERMKHQLPPEKQQALIQVALQEAHRLDSFVNNILDMAKFENGMVKPKSESIEIVGLARDCWSKLGSRVSECKIDYTGSPSLETTSDGMLLSRALGVVLDNAIKYGGENAHVKIDVSKKADETVIAIRDNGPGIPADAMDKVFDKYARFPVNGQHPSGMGIGLAIGRNIMMLLGGDITAANHPEGGAVFTVLLPTA